MYARTLKRKTLPVGYQCQDCEEFFSAKDADNCPNCFSKDRSNLVILHMEDDQDLVEWLEMIDFAAGD